MNVSDFVMLDEDSDFEPTERRRRRPFRSQTAQANIGIGYAALGLLALIAIALAVSLTIANRNNNNAPPAAVLECGAFGDLLVQQQDLITDCGDQLSGVCTDVGTCAVFDLHLAGSGALQAGAPQGDCPSDCTEGDLCTCDFPPGATQVCARNEPTISDGVGNFVCIAPQICSRPLDVVDVVEIFGCPEGAAGAETQGTCNADGTCSIIFQAANAPLGVTIEQVVTPVETCIAGGPCVAFVNVCTIQIGGVINLQQCLPGT